MSAPDTITILRGMPGRRLAKLVHADGTVEDYDAGYLFDLFPQRVAGIEDLDSLVQRLLPRPDCCAVWGVPVDLERMRKVRRLVYADKKTGDGPTLRDASHSWVAIDFDGVAPIGATVAGDIAACGRTAIATLPAEFRTSTCLVQATAGFGLKPGIRVRLWYWLSRPISSAEAKRWLGRSVDLCTFRTCQPIFTAAPVFAPGARDHLPTRIAFVPGAVAVAVPPPERLAPPAPRPAARVVLRETTGDYVRHALTASALRVRTAPVGNRHDTIVSEARWLERLVVAGLASDHEVASVLSAAGQDAGKPDDEIQKILVWARQHPSDKPVPKVEQR